MITLLPSPQRNAISDEGNQKGPRSVCGFNAPTTQPRRHRAGQQHHDCRGHRPGRGGRLQKSREFPMWLLPAGRFLVVAGSRGKFSGGGQFLCKKSRDFPWWLVPAGRVPVEASSRPKIPVNFRDGKILHEKFPRTKIVPEEGPGYFGTGPRDNFKLLTFTRKKSTDHSTTPCTNQIRVLACILTF